MNTIELAVADTADNSGNMTHDTMQLKHALRKSTRKSNG